MNLINKTAMRAHLLAGANTDRKHAYTRVGKGALIEAERIMEAWAAEKIRAQVGVGKTIV